MKRVIVLEGDNATIINHLVNMVEMSTKSYKGVTVEVHHDNWSWYPLPSHDDLNLYNSGAATGRLSTNEPNLSNVPQNGEYVSAWQDDLLETVKEIADTLYETRLETASIRDMLTQGYDEYDSDYEETVPDEDI